MARIELTEKWRLRFEGRKEYFHGAVRRKRPQKPQREDGPQAGTCWCLWDSKMPCNWNRVGKWSSGEVSAAMGGTEQAVTLSHWKDSSGFYSAWDKQPGTVWAEEWHNLTLQKGYSCYRNAFQERAKEKSRRNRHCWNHQGERWWWLSPEPRNGQRKERERGRVLDIFACVKPKRSPNGREWMEYF